MSNSQHSKQLNIDLTSDRYPHLVDLISLRFGSRQKPQYTQVVNLYWFSVNGTLRAAGLAGCGKAQDSRLCCRLRAGRGKRGLPGRLAFRFPQGTGLFGFAVAFGDDGGVAAFELVLG